MNDAWIYLDVATRRYVYRASSLGSCTRSLTAARLGESPTGPHAGLRAAMDASAGLEDVILARAEEQLWLPITGRQDTVDLEVGVVIEGPDGKELRNVVVRGHPDGQTDDCIIEVKALGDTYWEKYLNGSATPLGSLGQLGVRYRIQGAIYGHAKKKKVRFAIGHKVDENAGQGNPVWDVAEVHITEPYDPEELYPLETLMKRIRLIEEYAARDELPDCDGGCREGDPYSEAHIFPSAIRGDADLEKLCRRDKELDELISVLQEEKDELRKKVKESYAPGKYTAGPYTARIEKVKAVERVDTKRLKRERPDIVEEYKTFSPPTVRLTITGG